MAKNSSSNESPGTASLDWPNLLLLDSPSPRVFQTKAMNIYHELIKAIQVEELIQCLPLLLVVAIFALIWYRAMHWLYSKI